MTPTIAIFTCGWLLGWLFPWRWTAPMVRALIERARFDLERGWSEAAYDNLGRALSLLTTQPKERAP
jgi:hypothetical protein